VSVLGHLLLRQGDTWRSSLLAESIDGETCAASCVEGQAALQIRQVEGCSSVASVGCSQQREQRIVRRDSQGLPIAQCPALRRKAETDHPDLSEVLITHLNIPFVGASFWFRWNTMVHSNASNKRTWKSNLQI
jgi:hypothetical protein